MNSGFVECASWDFFLRLLKSYVHYNFIFPKIDKRGLEKKRWFKNFSKINMWENGYRVLESKREIMVS